MMILIKRILLVFLRAFCTYDYRIYWERRSEFYSLNPKSLKARWYSFYIYTVNKKENADIGLPPDHDIFAGCPPDNNHGLNGIVIDGGRKSVKTHSLAIRLQ